MFAKLEQKEGLIDVPVDTILEILSCVYMHVQRQIKQQHRKIYNAVVAYNVLFNSSIRSLCVLT